MSYECQISLKKKKCKFLFSVFWGKKKEKDRMEKEVEGVKLEWEHWVVKTEEDIEEKNRVRE